MWQPALRFAKRFVVATVLVSTFFVAVQDFLIFPGALTGLIASAPIPPSTAVEHRITTSDGETISVWRVAGLGTTLRKEVVLLFHGNAESLATTIALQKWFVSLGYCWPQKGFPMLINTL